MAGSQSFLQPGHRTVIASIILVRGSPTDVTAYRATGPGIRSGHSTGRDFDADVLRRKLRPTRQRTPAHQRKPDSELINKREPGPAIQQKLGRPVLQLLGRPDCRDLPT
ncbi:hypothetical protein GCM10010412_098020 [Nonomuraea recticatena]|uniref:Uncharacterized protein n=1 Tax=Nonomuraea recticatena TaxID=46178 RepID=A0ABP6FTW9_9ACTN